MTHSVRASLGWRGPQNLAASTASVLPGCKVASSSQPQDQGPSTLSLSPHQDPVIAVAHHHTWWLKTAQVHHLTVVEATVWHGSRVDPGVAGLGLWRPCTWAPGPSIPGACSTVFSSLTLLPPHEDPVVTLGPT